MQNKMKLNEESRCGGLIVVVSVTTELASGRASLFYSLVLSPDYLHSLQ